MFYPLLMASPSSEQRLGAPRRALPPDQLSAFYKLVGKYVIAGALSRHARGAELSACAAEQAEALFGGESLVVAHLRLYESQSLTSLAVGASGAEQEDFDRRAWAVLLSLIPLLLRRVEANTLLPGSLTEEELYFRFNVLSAMQKAQKIAPLPSPAELRAAASWMGYDILLLALARGLDLLPGPLCGPPHRGEWWSRLCS